MTQILKRSDREFKIATTIKEKQRTCKNIWVNRDGNSKIKNQKEMLDTKKYKK